ncbi:MAG: tRNA epoxyqueuosine(34) reductase QueG [Candidatus Dormibacter sp.]
MSLSDDVKTRARELGFVAVGATTAEPFTQAEAAALARTEQGLMDGLPWWSAARVRASADPRLRTPDAHSVIALAFPYAAPATDEVDEPDGLRGRIAAYALGRDYHDVLSERMQPLKDLLRQSGHQAKTYVDHGWMLDRAAGARAGIGWLGKNTNLLVPGVGSYVVLSEIVTSAEIEPDSPSAKSCGSCQACLRACPTGALIAPGVLDNRKCISFWTIEHHGVIPLDVRPLLGDWVFGCDLCQEVCPVNAYPRRAEPDPAATPAFGPHKVSGRPRLEGLLLLDDARFRDRFRGSAVWRTRREGLLRNVCIALGNLGDRHAVTALAGALLDQATLVRGHAAWALGRLGGSAARAHLETALTREDDAWVRDECGLARQECGPLVVR